MRPDVPPGRRRDGPGRGGGPGAEWGPALARGGPAAARPGGGRGWRLRGWQGERGWRGWGDPGWAGQDSPPEGAPERSLPARALQISRGFDGQPPRGPDIFGDR